MHEQKVAGLREVQCVRQADDIAPSSARTAGMRESILRRGRRMVEAEEPLRRRINRVAAERERAVDREVPRHDEGVVGSERCGSAVGRMVEFERRGLGRTYRAAVPHRHVALTRARDIQRAGLVRVELRVEAA